MRKLNIASRELSYPNIAHVFPSASDTKGSVRPLHRKPTENYFQSRTATVKSETGFAVINKFGNAVCNIAMKSVFI